MSLSSPFEVARSTHEESERYSSALASLLNQLPASDSSGPPTRSALTNAHLASVLTDRIVSRNRSLLDFYTDESGVKKEEEVAMAGGNSGEDGAAESSSMALFYSRLRHIQQHHEKYPSAPPETFSLDLPSLEGLIAPSASSVAMPATDPVDRLFSGEEGAGRYLDLYEYHSQYINLKGVKRVNYLTYLDRFHQFDSGGALALGEKKQEAYKKYLASLLHYLVTYLRKIRPLDDVDGMVRAGEEEFRGKWERGEAQGWEDRGEAFSQSAAASTASKSTSNATPAAAATPPADGSGIWCDACKKSFAKQTVFDAHLQGNKHKKAAEKAAASATTTTNGKTPASRAGNAAALTLAQDLARREYTISYLCKGPLANHCSDTRSNVERRAALTERERAAEAEAQELALRERGDGEGKREGGGDESDSDSEDKIYNPKKLPLGWDGRPIPVWLYKLHGLGVEFTCEICSDHVYQGRKNFDRHFNESRHSFGMRALGLPNTRHFHGITSIQDALALADRLKKEAKSGAAASSAAASASSMAAKDMEEVEDENGNTYTRKDYELLKRQGLI